MKIENNDLYYNKYTIEQLEENINNLEVRSLLSTQTLTPEFCVKYILSDDYASCVEDTYLYDYDVLKYQKHITKEALNKARIKLYNNESSKIFKVI